MLLVQNPSRNMIFHFNTNPNFCRKMQCATHRIFDKIDSLLTGLCDKNKEHKNFVALNAVVEIKLYGVWVHVQVFDKVWKCTVVDTTKNTQ